MKDRGKSGNSNRGLGLDSAYSLETPEDSIRLYRDWADTYDADFAEALGYNYPQHVASVWKELSGDRTMPILDAGCGTGLVAEELGEATTGFVDGLDISPEMLATAREKHIYRALIEGNLLERLPIPDDQYSAILSAGTFTHGHVGPEGLEELLRVAAANALFIIGVNAEHYRTGNFEEYISALVSSGRISTPEYRLINMYEYPGHEHSSDQARLLIFSKLCSP